MAAWHGACRYEKYAENGPARTSAGSKAATAETSQISSQPATGRDCGGTTGAMDAMFDRLRDAAAKHDGDCDLLPLIQDGAATDVQPER